MWDTHKGEIIRNLTNAHAPLTVLQLKVDGFIHEIQNAWS